MSLVQFDNRVGKPIETGEYKIVPVEQALQVQPPGMRGFLFWRKPAAVIVQYPDREDDILEIPDVTRQAQIGMIAFAVVVTLAAWLINRIR